MLVVGQAAVVTAELFECFGLWAGVSIFASSLVVLY